ncbi:GspH/FimT family pseudopilin [Marinobacter halotolerans]|uniref:GspH/FimT family pseudopilin n=1 Tax=Marinobacter halotolerans TaxID=1569211 RepID=UPI0012450960|nr:GspH/FimT family pseudopilin [Marinobacter halotolerans]
MTHTAFSKGLTLIELIIVVAILSITVTMAVPFTSGFIQNQMKESSRQSVLSALRFARATAIQSREVTTVCSLDSSGQCTSNWSNTLSVFHDSNDNAKLDAGETLTRNIPVRLEQWTQRNRPASRAHFEWNSLGIANGTPGSIEFCHPDSHTSRFAVVISFSGRIRTSMDFDGDGTEERIPGTPIAC